MGYDSLTTADVHQVILSLSKNDCTVNRETPRITSYRHVNRPHPLRMQTVDICARGVRQPTQHYRNRSRRLLAWRIRSCTVVFGRDTSNTDPHGTGSEGNNPAREGFESTCMSRSSQRCQYRLGLVSVCWRRVAARSDFIEQTTRVESVDAGFISLLGSL